MFNAASAFLLAAALALAVPSIALAHTMLKRSTPAAGARLTVVPRQLRLVFSEAPELAVSSIELRRAGGAPIRLGSLTNPADSRSTLLVAIEGPLASGEYIVAWRVMGDDGHPIEGQFSFTISPGATGVQEVPLTSQVPGTEGAASTVPGQAPLPVSNETPPESSSFDASSPLYVAIRWLLYTGLLAVLGAVVFHYAVLGRVRHLVSPGGRSPDAFLGQFGLIAALLVLTSAGMRLPAQLYAMHGTVDGPSSAMLTAMVGQTRWGWGWMLQVVAAVVTATGFVMVARTGRRSGLSAHAGAWALAAVGAVVLAFTPALAGHAASAPRLVPLAMLADGLHVIGAAGWLGSLLVAVTVGVPAALRLPEHERGDAVANLFTAFSPTALRFAGLTAVTGIFAAWLHVGSISALWQTDYGRTLLVKLGILSVVAATGAYNWLRVRPSLGDPGSATRIRRTASIELAVGVLVLIATAVLVATPPASDMRPTTISAMR